ncbi:MAG TPA: FixG Ig-like domain-containing protein [Usitatibacter sp.]|nr:FixG Ig-like domain-containing protein [Usitatibacter sp.]
MLRPRVLLYTTVLGAIVAAATLVVRSPLKMDVIRDRGSLAREVDDNHIENLYRLQIMNTEERVHRITLSVEGSSHLADIEIVADTPEHFITLQPVTMLVLPVRVRAVPHDTQGVQPIEFELRTVDGEGREIKVHEKSRFFVPSGWKPAR